MTILLMTSCNDMYRDFQTVKDMKWYKDDIKIFNVEISEEGEYDLFFTMRHSAGYPFTTIKVDILQITHKGKEFTKEAEFPITDKNGKYIGEATGQLYDIESSFSEKMFLEKGKYTFKISHNMNTNPVILVIDIGLIVRNSSK